jgi:hypothetical protein
LLIHKYYFIQAGLGLDCCALQTMIIQLFLRINHFPYTIKKTKLLFLNNRAIVLKQFNYCFLTIKPLFWHKKHYGGPSLHVMSISYPFTDSFDRPWSCQGLRTRKKIHVHLWIFEWFLKIYYVYLL